MTWDEFCELCIKMQSDGTMEDVESVFLSEKPQFYQNATRDRLHQTGKTIPANAEAVFGVEESALGNAKYSGDFVYFHGKETLQVAALGFLGGGHPCLAGMSTPNCAGQFLNRGFMFHSGHFQPTLQEGLAFFCQFVRNSCANLTGRARDDLVNQLARLTLDYYDYYEGPVHSTSLKILARKYRRTSETEVTSPRISGTSPISIQGSRSEPRPIGGFPKSSPISVKQVKPTVGTALSGSPKDEILTAERIQPTRPRTPSISNFFETGRTEKRALWMPDSTRKTCTICNSAFTFINRKHHCRRCGNLVCDSCSTARRVVKLPAVEKPSEAVAVSNGAVRVCDSCKDLRDL